MAKNLPLGLQDFRTIRECDFIYVDKTRFIFDLVTKPSAYFLSRPRRFGKSITLSTLKVLYNGSRSFFSGLWIESRWDWSKVHPVVHFNFTGIGIREKGLEYGLNYLLDSACNPSRFQL
jgi:hypothetical protein